MIRVFKHYIPVSLLLLAIAEFFVLWSSAFVGLSLDPIHDYPVEGINNSYIILICLFFFVMLSAMTAMGLYQRRLQDDYRDLIFRIGLSFVCGIFVLGVVLYTAPVSFPDTKVLGITIAVAFVGIVSARILFLHIADKNLMRKRVLILGAGESALLIEQLRRRSDTQGFVIVGYVPVPGEENLVDPTRIISNENCSLQQLAKEYCVDEVVVAVKDRRNKLPVHDLLNCKMSGVKMLGLPAFFERQLGRVRLEVVQPSWMIFSDGFHQNAFGRFIKRCFDLVISAVLLFFTWPIMLFTAIVIYFEGACKGDILYRQERIGENGKVFNVLKFRSMCMDAEKDGAPQWAQKNDHRITKIGHIIRKARIDELPQLFNVFRGDMSFVGPRPERPHFIKQLSENIPFYEERHRVKPGITGWAQICYPYGSSEDDARAKLEYDLYYVKNYSLFLDFTILFQTAEVILWGRGAR